MIAVILVATKPEHEIATVLIYYCVTVWFSVWNSELNTLLQLQLIGSMQYQISSSYRNYLLDW